MGRENKTFYVILGFLNHEDLTGYEIKKKIDTSLRYFWGTGFGQIYPSLNMLEKGGYITKRTDTKGQKMERIKYSITESGKQKLVEWLSKPIENEIVKYEILLKLFFGNLLDVQKNIENIHDFKEKYMQQLPILKGYETQLRMILNNSPDHLYFMLTVLFGEKIYNAYVEWADEAVELLKQSMNRIKEGEIE